MILRNVYIRFFRAFNFDYLRAHHTGARKDPWDALDGDDFYPFIRLGIDRELTTVVGANESGKSQLLDAIEFALGSKFAGPEDFCRYSRRFTVTEQMRVPQVGLEFAGISDLESNLVRGLVGEGESGRISTLRVFRTRPEHIEIYLDDDSVARELDAEQTKALESILPGVFRIRPDLAIPDSVPIDYLIQRTSDDFSFEGPTRQQRLQLSDAVVPHFALLQASRGDQSSFANAMQHVFQTLNSAEPLASRNRSDYQLELQIAFDLLVTIGGIEQEAFKQLKKALRNENEGLAIGIVDLINREIDTRLDLARWWTQDSRFRLAIEARDSDIVFTIRDRTNSAYSFAERSFGMRYFLSYLVQILTHLDSRTGTEVLLMDEPDAYLSNQGQQDLLQLFKEFALPIRNVPAQAVYVTHSPFLIDKNRADRIRLLEKGSDAEGTRVVPNVAQNHYEPIRTALGGLIGDSAFIGNCNLVLEGPADQHYMAAMSQLIRETGSFGDDEYLDLNQVTLVPADGASEVPYKTYSAVGRGSSTPAVIVLVDGDPAGDKAVNALRRFGPGRKPLLPSECIVQLNQDHIPGLASDRSGDELEIEDLIPVEIAISALHRYVSEVSHESPADSLPPNRMREMLADGNSVFAAAQELLDSAGIEIELAKRSFARHAIASCAAGDGQSGQVMRERFAKVFTVLTAKLRAVEKQRARESTKSRLDREMRGFRKTHRRRPPAKRHVVRFLQDEIRPIVEQSVDRDQLLEAIRGIERDFELDSGMEELVEPSEALFESLEALKYAGDGDASPDVV